MRPCRPGPFRGSIDHPDNRVREAPDAERGLGVFEFVIVVVLVTTIGKVVEARAARPPAKDALPSPSPQEWQQLEEALADMNGRLVRLEEERDFYKALLEPGEKPGSDAGAAGALRPPVSEPGDSVGDR